jgi:hypothetical protein
MAKDRKKPAAPSLRFDFNEAVKKVVRDHPQLKKGALYINAANDDWDTTEAALVSMSVDEDDIDEIKKGVKEARRLKTSFCQAISIDGKNMSAVILHPDKNPLYGAAHGAGDDIGTFDHETSHALTPGLSGTLGENTADAYASLRHLQRFKGEEDDIDYCGWKRAAIFMRAGVPSHLTTFTLDRILCDAKTADFMSLTPAETIAIAKDYAKKHTPGDKKLKRLQNDFKRLKKLPLDETFNKLAQITLKADVKSDTFYLGARVLKGALQEGGVTLDGEHIALTGGKWDKVRRKLDAKIDQLPAKHPLRRKSA